MPQIVQADLDPLWLRVLPSGLSLRVEDSHRHRRALVFDSRLNGIESNVLPQDRRSARTRSSRSAIGGGVGMRFFVGFSQPAGADVCVDLRGGETFVSQKLLHASQVSPPVQQMGCKTMP